MKFECPYGWKSVIKCGNCHARVGHGQYLRRICDSADRCGIETCEFYDTSPEATRRFLRGSAREHTVEHLLAPIN